MASSKPADPPPLLTTFPGAGTSTFTSRPSTSPRVSPSHSPRTSIDRASLLGQFSGAPLTDIPLPNPSKRESIARPQPSLREALGRVRASATATASSTASGSVNPPFSPPSAASPPIGAPTFSSPTAGGGGGGATFSPLGRNAANLERQQREKPQTTLDRTDAVWAEMQRTLQEVELSASRGTHFFGRGHPAALKELRNAQIALAQAWAREGGEEEGMGMAREKESTVKERERDKGESDSEKSPGASISDVNADGTEADMVTAQRRREASDRYFDRVGRHVEEVTKRLEDVAVAMGKVEEESREGWSEDEDEGLDSDIVTTGEERESVNAKEKEKEKEEKQET